MPNLLNKTFRKYILISNDRNYVYRHREHGGLIDDPIYADTANAITVHLRNMKYLADKDHSQYNPWDYAEMQTQIELKSNLEEFINTTIDAQIKEQALAKLSEEEKKILGLI